MSDAKTVGRAFARRPPLDAGRRRRRPDRRPTPDARTAPDGRARAQGARRPARIAADARVRGLPARPSLGLRLRFAGLRGSNTCKEGSSCVELGTGLGLGVETHEKFSLGKNVYAPHGKPLSCFF